MLGQLNFARISCGTRKLIPWNTVLSVTAANANRFREQHPMSVFAMNCVIERLFIWTNVPSSTWKIWLIYLGRVTCAKWQNRIRCHFIAPANSQQSSTCRLYSICTRNRFYVNFWIISLENIVHIMISMKLLALRGPYLRRVNDIFENSVLETDGVARQSSKISAQQAMGSIFNTKCVCRDNVFSIHTFICN